MSARPCICLRIWFALEKSLQLKPPTRPSKSKGARQNAMCLLHSVLLLAMPPMSWNAQGAESSPSGGRRVSCTRMHYRRLAESISHTYGTVKVKAHLCSPRAVCNASRLTDNISEPEQTLATRISRLEAGLPNS